MKNKFISWSHPARHSESFSAPHIRLRMNLLSSLCASRSLVTEGLASEREGTCAGGPLLSEGPRSLHSLWDFDYSPSSGENEVTWPPGGKRGVAMCPALIPLPWTNRSWWQPELCTTEKELGGEGLQHWTLRWVLFRSQISFQQKEEFIDLYSLN